MRLTPPEPDFTPGDKGFDDKDPATGQPYDLLSRKALGQQLSELIERIDQPLVIAFDGAWGSEKSHFLKLWTGAHRKENGGTAKIIYFDAFQHDYLDDPLVGLVGAILQEPPEASWTGKAISNVKSAASKLLRPVARIGLAVGTAGTSEVAVAALDPILDAIGKEGEKAIDALWAKEASRKNAMQQFRDALTALAQDAEGKPQKIVFIIDELDRCRPDYALGLLEVIKHFFSVDNLHFILGTNLSALENSVKARYGEGIDAARYLQKFVHVTMGFPDIRNHEGDGVWAGYFDHISRSMNMHKDIIENAKLQLRFFNQNHTVNLRDIQRVCSRLAILPEDVKRRHWGYQMLCIAASVMRVIAAPQYGKLRSGHIQLSDIEEIFLLDTQIQAGNHVAQMLNYCWRRVLIDDPDAETMEATKGAFGHYGQKLNIYGFNRFLTETLETFHLSEDNP